jgi:hypothetical protein
VTSDERENGSHRSEGTGHRPEITGQRSEQVSLRHDAVRSNGKGNDNVAIDGVFVGDIKIENLVSVPEESRKFVTT